jgi:hypothetical protein
MDIFCFIHTKIIPYFEYSAIFAYFYSNFTLSSLKRTSAQIVFLFRFVPKNQNYAIFCNHTCF